MKREDQIKVGHLLQQNAEALEEQQTKIAQLTKELQELKCEKEARDLVEAMSNKGLIDESVNKEAAVASLTKMAMEDRPGFEARREGVKLAGSSFGHWGIGTASGGQPATSTRPGETEFDQWVKS